MGDVEAGECLPPLSPKGCGEWSGETRATEEGPPVGAEGVGWTRALPDPGRTREMAGPVGGTVPQAVLHPPVSDQGFPLAQPNRKPGSPGHVFCGGQPPRAESASAASVTGDELDFL